MFFFTSYYAGAKVLWVVFRAFYAVAKVLRVFFSHHVTVQLLGCFGWLPGRSYAVSKVFLSVG